MHLIALGSEAIHESCYLNLSNSKKKLSNDLLYPHEILLP